MSFHNLTLFNNLDPNHQGLLHKKESYKKNASSVKAVPIFWGQTFDISYMCLTLTQAPLTRFRSDSTPTEDKIKQNNAP